MAITIPDKLYFKIGEVAKLAGVPTHVLRYWETEFPAIKPKRASSNQRLYRKKDVELILQVRVLLHKKGFTIAGAKKLLASGKDIDKVLDELDHQTGANVSSRLKDIKQELKVLQTLLRSEKEEG